MRYGKTTKSTDPIHRFKIPLESKVPSHIQKLCTALALFVLSAQRVPHAVLVHHAPCIHSQCRLHKQVLLRPAPPARSAALVNTHTPRERLRVPRQSPRFPPHAFASTFGLAALLTHLSWAPSTDLLTRPAPVPCVCADLKSARCNVDFPPRLPRTARTGRLPTPWTGNRPRPQLLCACCAACVFALPLFVREPRLCASLTLFFAFAIRPLRRALRATRRCRR